MKQGQDQLGHGLLCKIDGFAAFSRWLEAGHGNAVHLSISLANVFHPYISHSSTFRHSASQFSSVAGPNRHADHLLSAGHCRWLDEQTGPGWV